MGSTQVGFRHACKILDQGMVTVGNKHSSLLQQGINYDSNKFYSTGLWSQYLKEILE